MDYVEGKKYWLSFEDGSRVLVEARHDRHGTVDLYNDYMDFVFFMANEYPDLDIVEAESESLAPVEQKIADLQRRLTDLETKKDVHYVYPDPRDLATPFEGGHVSQWKRM